MQEFMCQSCGKHPAIFHYTIEAPDGLHEIHLCEKCIENLGEFENELRNLSEQLTTDSGALQKAVDFLLKIINKNQQAVPDTSPSLNCPQCRSSLRDFKNEGFLGCPMCYRIFSEELELIYPRLHEGSRSHRGKSPKPGDRKMRRCLELESALSRAVADEDYEAAARFRDQLTEARKELSLKE
jgi:protein arginine kinase activator